MQSISSEFNRPLAEVTCHSEIPSNNNPPYHLKGRWATACNLLLLAVLIFSLAACGIHTCRVQSINDAERYASQGYDTRIAVYRQGFEGQLWGAFIWQYHVQAQVNVNNKWKWVGMTGISDTPTFSMVDGEVFYWTVNEYKRLLEENGRYY